MRKLENRRIPNGTYGGVRGRRATARLLLDWGKWGRALAARGEIELAPLVIPER